MSYYAEWMLREHFPLYPECVVSDPIDALVARLEASLKRQEAAVAATKAQLEAARKLVRKV